MLEIFADNPVTPKCIEITLFIFAGQITRINENRDIKKPAKISWLTLGLMKNRKFLRCFLGRIVKIPLKDLT